jgi:hypothetical protein
MINNYKFFDFIVYYQRNTCFNMHLSTYFWNASIESRYHIFAKFSYKYMKVTYQLELLYFQVDESLACMDMVSKFHILVIIYQSFNVKVFWKFEQPINLEHTFHPYFLYNNSSNFMYNLQ